MALTKDDLQAIKDVVIEGVGDGLEDVVNPRLDRIEGRLTDVDLRLATVEKTQDLEFRKINNRLDSLDVWQSDFRKLVTLLAEKKVLTSDEASELHVQLGRPAA